MPRVKREQIIKSCRNHIEQMREAGEGVSFSQLFDFAYQQIPFHPDRRAQNKAMALGIVKEVYGAEYNFNRQH